MSRKVQVSLNQLLYVVGSLINVDKNEVTIKNGTVVTNLTFKVVKNTVSESAKLGVHAR